MMEFPIDEYEWKYYVEDGMQEWNKRVLQYVYSSHRTSSLHDGDVSSSTHISLESLEDYINYQLETTVACAQVPCLPAGRLGPSRIIFDVTSNVGSLVIDKDRLGVSSQSSFSSIRANCCVYKGKWQYELMLGSKGVMQVGWATIACKFSQEKGIGDTADSYSFDGNRVQKWNVVTSKYGEPWLTGDVIGSTIDLDVGKVHFYRNGRCLGEAFDNVRIGPGVAYFPAVSLVYNENLVANFGASPLRYPVDGYSALELAPWADTLKAEKLLFWLERFLPFYDQDLHSVNEQLIPEHHGWMHLPERGKKSAMLLMVMPLMHHLGPLLASPYITEACLLPFLFKLCNMSPWKLGLSQDTSDKNGKILTLLDIMWALMEQHEIQECVDNLIVSLLTGYRFSSSTVDFYYQRCYLMLTLHILYHDCTRHYLLQEVLFDKIKFPVFLEIKPLDNSVLNKLVHTVWFDMGKEDLDDEELQRKTAYQNSYVHLEKGIVELQKLQLQILVQIFKTSSRKNEVTSQSIFLLKFGEFLRENSGGSRIPMVHLCPLPVALAFFHRLISLLRHYMATIKSQNPFDPYLMNESELTVPLEVFYNGSVNYVDVQRVGGLASHLQKVHQEELREALGKSRSVEYMDTSGSSPDTSHSMLIPQSTSSDRAALIELLDGIIRLYVIAAHRHLEKMCSIKETMQEYVTALTDLEFRLDCCEPDTRDAIVQARDVFLKKLDEQARHLAWVCTTIYSKNNRNDIYWLLKILLRTLNAASNSGSLFSFVPDFYVEACIKTCNALRSFFAVTTPSEELPGWDETLTEFACFLAHHFSDARIVNADLKDSLVQALAAFVCYPNTMKALESMSEMSRVGMVKSLLQPYENRAWAQSNWILVRLWKGCGFAFRYAVPPHLARRLSVKAQQQNESSTSNHHRPCPSQVFQNHVLEWLKNQPDLAASFLSSVLNQLNWAFSEFIGMLQEIQNASNRPERVFIDSRQLKICATCFDLASALLRVLEMVIHLDPELFTDWTRPSAEILLTRLCQLLCQVLNRVTSRSGCFELVVSMDIPGLEIVDHFPILVTVAGILLALATRGPLQSRECAINVLIAEPSFQPSSLDYILGFTVATSQKPVFSLDKYGEVSTEERQQVTEMVQMLQNCHKQLQVSQTGNVVDEEMLCTICYANPKSAKFQPCGHQSCRSCISLHLLHQRDCFFCKAIIANVVSNSGEILNLNQPSQK